MIRISASKVAIGIVLMFFTCLAIPLVAPVVSAEQKEYISTLVPLPQTRAAFGMVEDDGKLYMIGGTVNALMSGADALDSVLIYDIEDGTVTQGDNMDYGVELLAVAKGFDGMIYAFGGYNTTLSYISSTQIYDPVADEWTLGSPAPVDVGLCQAVAIPDNRIVIVGPTGSSNSTLIYDTVADSWSYGADQAVSTIARAACLWNGKVVVMGGNFGGVVADVDIYDPIADSWSTGAPMTVAGGWGSAALGRDGMIYCAGTSDSGITPRTVIQRFDPVANVSDVADVSLSPTRGFIGFTSDDFGRLFAAGGWNGGATYYATVQMIVNADVVSDEVTFVTPGNGAIVSGNVAVGVQISSSTGIPVVVDLMVDGTVYSTQKPSVAILTIWFSWNTSGLSDGSPHVLTARLLMPDAEIIEASITVIVTSMSAEAQLAAALQQLAIVQAKLDGIIAGMTAAGVSSSTMWDQLNVTFVALQQQLDDFQEQIDRVEDKADTASTYGLVTLVLVIIVILLVALIIMKARKG